MKVILKEDIKSLGKAGDIVNVSDGYARNYLIPRGLALVADEKNIKTFELQKKKLLEAIEKEKARNLEFAERLKNLTVTIKAKAGEDGKLFGSITTMHISEALRKEGIELDRKRIVLSEPIKRTGEYRVAVKLPHEINSEFTLRVLNES
ncbi:MAG: 50S ribosomal protein L9 [Thermodesulfovibrionales bacterium]|nr:50S ribosomal protein L9 [Thermodesulfovibrionales bacterium]